LYLLKNLNFSFNLINDNTCSRMRSGKHVPRHGQREETALAGKLLFLDDAFSHDHSQC